MELRCTLDLISYLLEHVFHSKKDMAQRIGVGYRTLLNMLAGNANQGSAMVVLDRMLYYCILHRIPLCEVFEQGF